ncbi:bifunctional serine/threonine-protein kinase/formylglycine-generating enzyme family protein [uncultured Amphritea sp.]|uniref:bifunctional serine/threonine-protein kinase/formylglycine-generating enzyme family protein n=1 Tax=uncultured Amphritea sp. TaxID=981605 RepID=UPI0025E63DEA|nr:bifunctional serine/threonine-protein kinase/formylglycine-generating enzyme family protein [uncultured Amphritea sp.]
MKDFKHQLQQYLHGHVSLDTLLETVSALLVTQPQLQNKVAVGLQQMATRQLLTHDDLTALMRVIERSVGDESSLSESDSTVIIEANAAGETDDRTLVKSALPYSGQDQTRITSVSNALLSRVSSTDSVSTPPVTSVTAATGTSTSRWDKPFTENDAGESVVGVGTVIKDRFRLVEFIGCGGMGDVYKAEDQRRIDAQDIDSLVAIKLLNKTFREHPESLRSLQREARKTQNLAHPNIVNVFDFDRDREHVFMTMELMRGAPLNTVIKNHPTGFPLSTVLDYAAGMAGALGYAHQQGVVHSDLKPSNVFLDGGQIKVFDFGIARAAKSGVAQEDNFDAGDLGALTPSYASPAMLAGASAADPRDDLYALGCIIYELLTGKHPFLRNNKKVPADEAWKAGMKVAELKQLSRNQNKALKQLLAFDERHRTESVEAFLQQFMPQYQRHSLLSRWYVWVMMFLFVCGISYFPLRNLWQQQQMDDFVDDLANQDEGTVNEWLERIQTMGAEQQSEFFNDAQVKRELTRYFLQQVSINADADAYSRAQFLAERALHIYEDSRRLSDKQEQLIKQKAARLNDLNNELNRLLELPAESFAAASDSLMQLMESIQKVDPGSAMLSDARLPVKFIETMSELIAQRQFQTARKASNTSSTLFPGNPELGNARRNLELEELRYNRAQRIAELNLRLDDLEPGNLSHFAAASPDIQELKQLDSGNMRVSQLQESLMELLLAEQQQLTSQYLWNQARELVATFEPALSPEGVARLELAWKKSHAETQKDIDRLVTAIDADITAQRIDEAEQRIDQLQPMVSDLRIITAVYDRLASALIKQSRVAQDEQRWQNAADLLDRVKTLSVSPELQQSIQYEQQQLVQQQQMNAQQLEASALAERELNRKAELDSLLSELEVILLDPQLSDSTTRKAQNILDRIETQTADPDVVTQGRQRLTRRYSEKAAIVAETDIVQAISILEDGKRLLPGQPDITDLLTQLQARYESASQQEKEQQLQALKQQLDELLTDARVSPEWETRVEDLISRLKVEQSDPLYLQGADSRIAAIYVQQSQRLAEKNEFNAARDSLDRAAQFDSSLSLTAPTAAIVKAEEQFRQQQAERKGEARISGLKQTFDTQIQANDLTAARQTFTRLKELLDEEDPFIKQQAPQTFQAVYLRLADQLAARQRFTQAEKLLQSARDLVVDQSTIDQRIASYQKGVRLYHIGQAIKNPDLKNMEQAYEYLSEMQSGMQPEKYQQLSQDLQRAVVDQISSLERRSPARARQLLQKAQQLFPDNDQLQQIRSDRDNAQTDKQSPVLTSDQHQTPPAKNQLSVQPNNTRTEQPSGASAAKPVSDRVCSAKLAGKGIRSAAVCWDMLSDGVENKGPFMIVVPAGEKSLAISKFEISRRDYNLYCKLSGECKGLSGAEKQPATGLSQNQINSYSAWLSNATGYVYRLPAKAEWINAATATGNNQPQNYNCRLSRGDQILKGRDLISVQQGKPNAWGLVNYLGNAQELVRSASGLEAMGGSYQVKMSDCAVSMAVPISGTMDGNTGFRLVREL